MKTNQLIKLSILFFLALSTNSCSDSADLANQEEEISEVVGYPNVDEELWPYFEKFEIEGKQEGWDIDLVKEGITGTIAEIEENNVLGQCSFNRANPNHVMIDKTFWSTASDRFKEFVVFHELGHCFLLRDHLEDVNVNGTCVSIMRSGTGFCRDNYTAFTRENYIDELFDRDRFNDINF
ncbi:hypothetical protein [Flexithrix dorotheae]|uniref:hypothetical protein n=1 Tax=Flexithrix dorotheae TaxID=70993 RepID=UPI000365DEB6|nr:hypothetical protein [Flexithrix dorotheae]